MNRVSQYDVLSSATIVELAVPDAASRAVAATMAYAVISSTTLPAMAPSARSRSGRSRRHRRSDD
jgi:hypothetical protein